MSRIGRPNVAVWPYEYRERERFFNAQNKLGPFDRKLILCWLNNNLEDCDNPRAQGKGLTGNHNGEWRYRVGDYLVIAQIQDAKVHILILHHGHRRDANNKN